MKNERTPRTLSECSFVTGYPVAHRRHISLRDRIGGVLLAVAMFAALALLLFINLSK